MKSKIEYILIFIVIALLALPFALEKYFPKAKIKSLKGTVEYADSIPFTSKNWFSKLWQENQEELIKKNMKIRPSVVRTQHELDYKLFNKFNMGDLLVGKDGFLFSWGWADSRCCINNLDNDSLLKFVEKLGVLKNLFERKGKYLKIIIVPGKEEVFANKLPNKYAYNNPDNDYNRYKNALNKFNVEYWDLLSFYQSIMDTASYPIYSKTSVHWTKYGADFAIKKILADVNSYFNNSMSTIYVNSTKVSKFDNGDGDTETTLNLMSRIDTSDFLYFTYETNKKQNAFTPKILTIADSYYWNIKGCFQLQNIYSMESKFLFYYSTAYYPTWDPPRPVKELDIVEEFKSTDGLVLLNSSHNLANFPFGFQYDIDKIISALETLPDRTINEVVTNSIQ